MLECQPGFARSGVHMSTVKFRDRSPNGAENIAIHGQFIGESAAMSETCVVNARRVLAKQFRGLIFRRLTGDHFAGKRRRIGRGFALQNSPRGIHQMAFHPPIIRQLLKVSTHTQVSSSAASKAGKLAAMRRTPRGGQPPSKRVEAHSMAAM